MVCEYNLIGRFVTLKSAEEDDAVFIIRLRNDETISRYLPKIPIDLEAQIRWIRKQREREGEYYFVIHDNTDNRKIGTQSIYNIRGSEAEAGRAASFGTAIQNTEAFLLLYDFAFNKLKLERTWIEVMRDNEIIINLNKRLGYKHYPSKDTDRMLCFTLERWAYYESTKNIRKYYEQRNRGYSGQPA